MLKADDVVHDRGHRRALRLGVSVRERDRDFFVGGEDELGRPAAAVVHERVVEPAEGRAGVQGNVLDTDGAQEVHDEVGAVPRCRRHPRASRELLHERAVDARTRCFIGLLLRRESYSVDRDLGRRAKENSHAMTGASPR